MEITSTFTKVEEKWAIKEIAPKSQIDSMRDFQGLEQPRWLKVQKADGGIKNVLVTSVIETKVINAYDGEIYWAIATDEERQAWFDDTEAREEEKKEYQLANAQNQNKKIISNLKKIGVEIDFILLDDNDRKELSSNLRNARKWVEANPDKKYDLERAIGRLKAQILESDNEDEIASQQTTLARLERRK